MQLPIAQYPEVAPPTVQVTATYPGANAKTVADTVATPIEQEVNGVERMLYMSSKCTNDGQMMLDVTFELGTNLDTAQVLVQTACPWPRPSCRRRSNGSASRSLRPTFQKELTTRSTTTPPCLSKNRSPASSTR